MKKRLLLISNSTNYQEKYLEWCTSHIKNFLDQSRIHRVLFIPYAGIALSEHGVEDSYNVYEARVNGVLNRVGIEVYSIHHENDPVAAVRDALAIAVGGGNTFHLFYMMHHLRIMKPVKDMIESGIPFLGWFAGANIACPTLCTTNDMPIIEPGSFSGLSLVPFQINPHYLDVQPEGHGGETREQRIEEFMVVNDTIYVVGLRESTYLLYENDHLHLGGARPARIFRYGHSPKEAKPGSDLDFLI